MTGNTGTAPNMAALEQLLSDVRDRTGIDPTIAEAMIEAANLCQTARTVHAGIHMQLQAALASLRNGHADDSAQFIECAVSIQGHWTGRA